MQKTVALLDKLFKPVVQQFRTDREDNNLSICGLKNTCPKFFQNYKYYSNYVCWFRVFVHRNYTEEPPCVIGRKV